jgi:hypothetical protein
MGEKLIRH